MVRRELGGGDFRLETKSAVAIVRRLAPRVGLVQLSGDLDDELYEPVAAFMTQLIEPSGPLQYFIDAEQVTTYASGIRTNWTAWFQQHKGRVECYVLLKSALVKMAISLVNLVTGNVIRPFSDRQAFEALMRQVIAERAPDIHRSSLSNGR